MSFIYWLPDKNGQKNEYKTDSNSVIVIGANGAGKSHLGAWIEQQSLKFVHRIAAQRKLNFKDNIPLKNYAQAEDIVMFGTDDQSNKESKIHKWGLVNNDEYTTRLIDDFENVLSALIAKRNNEIDIFFKACQDAEVNQTNHPHTPDTVIDKLYRLWNAIFPHRELRLDDSKFIAVQKTENGEVKYSATKMSDGERSVLYFAAQVLCVPENKTLIVDEPELHLHKSLMNCLWTELENFRKDCLFIYITHDTQFAALHTQADKVWIKQYDGNQCWNFERILDSDLPEELLLDLLGNRKPVLFVEGEKNSFDSALYARIFPSYYVVPCGSCSQVIARTKIFCSNPMLHHIQAYGIIDRDYRSEHEIKAYEADGIYVLDVAEVENLFISEPLIKAFAVHLGLNGSDILKEISEYVIERFKNQLPGQVCQAVVSEIKYKLNIAEISKKNDMEAISTLDTVFKSIDYESIKAERLAAFSTIANSNDYSSIVRVFNQKGIAKSIGHFFGMKDNEYCQTILNLVNAKNFSIIDAISESMPKEIPR